MARHSGWRSPCFVFRWFGLPFSRFRAEDADSPILFEFLIAHEDWPVDPVVWFSNFGTWQNHQIKIDCQCKTQKLQCNECQVSNGLGSWRSPQRNLPGPHSSKGHQSQTPRPFHQAPPHWHCARNSSIPPSPVAASAVADQMNQGIFKGVENLSQSKDCFSLWKPGHNYNQDTVPTSQSCGASSGKLLYIEKTFNTILTLTYPVGDPQGKSLNLSKLIFCASQPLPWTWWLCCRLRHRWHCFCWHCFCIIRNCPEKNVEGHHSHCIERKKSSCSVCPSMAQDKTKHDYSGPFQVQHTETEPTIEWSIWSSSISSSSSSSGSSFWGSSFAARFLSTNSFMRRWSWAARSPSQEW